MFHAASAMRGTVNTAMDGHTCADRSVCTSTAAEGRRFDEELQNVGNFGRVRSSARHS